MRANLPLWVLLVLLAPAAALPAFAQSPEPSPAGEAEATGGPAQGAGDEAPLPPPGEDPGPPSDEDFVPSERIPADASIAFPVDI